MDPLAQYPGNLAALQAAVLPSGSEAGESLPSDLMALGLEDLMGLRVGSRADPDWDDAPRDRDRPQETLPAGAPAVTAPGGATRPAGAEPWGELPADLITLSLAQLMDLPLRAPQTEPEAESELAEEGTEDETVPAVAQTQAGRGSEEAEAPPRAATGAAFSAPDLDGDGAADPEGPVDSRGRGAPEGDDALEGTAPPGTVGAVRFAALLDAHGDAGPDSAAAFGTFGPTLGGGGGGNLNLIGGAGADTLDGGNGKDTLLGGAGDDSLVWDKVDDVIDGGAGDDTLLAGGGDVRLTSYSGAITSIERVDMSGDGAGTRLTLDAQDVLDMNSADTLTVSGDVGDSVEAGAGWTDGGIVGAFHVYTQGLATLAVDLDVTVNADITR